MKIFNKIVWSKKEPINKNDIWFDGSAFRVYTEGSWEVIIQNNDEGYIPMMQEFSDDFNNDFTI